jgi:N-acetyl-gamma-glutamyl-phosphate reductase
MTVGHSALKAGIVGVSGYSGMELARLLSRHPRFELTLATSDRWAGKQVGDMIALGGATAAVPIVGQEEGAARFGDLAVLFLCTPPEASIEIAPRALAAGTRVVDLSGGFRLAAEMYPRWYGFTHAAPDTLAQAVYSLPEATGNAEVVRHARLVSNPGCYPTASSLALLPLLRAGLVSRDGLIVDAKSGVTGAGRKATEAMSFSEVADDFKAYRVLKHQHTPEIERILVLAGAGEARVTFTAHLLPVRRGIVATAYARLTDSSPDPNAAVTEALQAFASDKPFVRVVAPEEVTLRSVVGTNRVAIGARADVERGVVVSIAALDNLVKGAAGQAVQNANLMFGFPEIEGLADVAGHQP